MESKTVMEKEIDDILKENLRRNEQINARFNPITGEGSTGDRQLVRIPDFPVQRQWLPLSMMRVPLVQQIIKAGTIAKFLKSIGGTPDDRPKVVRQFVRLRMRHDFPFWAAAFVFIKQKGGGEDIRFRLNRPQRKLISVFESMRTAGQPIRVILLKARQWGGSTATQMYMAWLQLVHKVGLNSLIVGHVKDASTEVKDMFDRMLNAYPVEMLHQIGEQYQDSEPKLVGVGKTGNIQRIPQRNCKIKIGTAEMPNSARGGDYNLVHLTEVGLWKTTEGKTPEDIVRSACSGILLQPYTMIVYESTANGTGNFFQREYDAAKAGTSQFRPLFVAWYEIEQYALPFTAPTAPTSPVPSSEATDLGRVPSTNLSPPTSHPSPLTMAQFASSLYASRLMASAPSNREEPGTYLWRLWKQGATLEAINWYVQERRKYTDHGDMASEFPSDDVEAFVHSGARVFDRYKVELLKPACRPPRAVGDVQGRADTGEDALANIRFIDDRQGFLHVWAMPEKDDADEVVTDRYLTVVDIGGRSNKADWSVICVFDRIYMMDGGKPTVVAQWYGHIDIDLLAWKAAQIAAFYNDSLLVIESNTLETHDRERQVDGDQSQFILNQIKDVYPNLYARRQSEEDIREGAPRKYGFHTNVATKPMIISTLVKVIRESLYVERDVRCLDEYITYERKKNGAYGAIPGKHDDLLMTRAIGLHICFFEMDTPTVRALSSSHVPHRRIVSAATF